VVFGRRVDRCRLGFAGGARSVSTPPPRIRYSGSPSWRRRRVSLRSRGSRLPRRDRRGDGGDLVGGFCFSSSSSSRWRPLRRRREDEICTGVLFAGLVGLALVSEVAWFVLGCGSVAGGFGAASRRRSMRLAGSGDRRRARGWAPTDEPQRQCEHLRCSTIEVLKAQVWQWSCVDLGHGGFYCSLSWWSPWRRRSFGGGSDLVQRSPRTTLYFFSFGSSFCKMYGPTCPSGPFRVGVYVMCTRL
jgi:hypothetical protein